MYQVFKLQVFNCLKKILCYFVLVLKVEIKKMVLKCNVSLEKNVKLREFFVFYEMVIECFW